MIRALPETKTIVDSIGDGIVDAAEWPVRCAENVAAVATVFANSVKGNMDNIKERMPDDPSVIPDTVVVAVGQTFEVGLGMVEALAKGTLDSFEAVRKQISRVTR